MLVSEGGIRTLFSRRNRLSKTDFILEHRGLLFLALPAFV
jgi:hypothetical protein